MSAAEPPQMGKRETGKIFYLLGRRSRLLGPFGRFHLLREPRIRAISVTMDGGVAAVVVQAACGDVGSACCGGTGEYVK